MGSEKILMKSKDFLLDIFFPKFCANCQREGTYLCADCFSLIDLADRQYCPFCAIPKETINGKPCNSCKKSKFLDGLFSAADYKNSIVKKLIKDFKYEPYVKDLARTLSFIIISFLLNLENKPDFGGFSIVPIPLHIKKMKKRGFNQSEELAKELSKDLEIPFLNNILERIKNTTSQAELSKEERIINASNAFICRNPKTIKDKKILLIDDVFTTGSTMEECAKTLKQSGAKEVWGMTIARG